MTSDRPGNEGQIFDDALARGDVFAGRYEILRPIGRGSMGVVYEVEDRHTGQRRALKLLSPRFLNSAEFRRRFELEAKLPARIDSEHVAKVLDTGTDPSGTPFIVMELLNGSDLASHLEQHGALGAADTVACLAQIASVLEQAHALGIVHRDLKPSNVFLTRSPEGALCIKVLDFGIAKLTTSSASQTQSILGSAHFMAPEQIRYKRVAVDARADIYALGHLAYCMLTAEPYWLPEDEAADGLVHLMMDVAFGATEAPSVRAGKRRGVALSSAFDAWFARATAVEPSGRFESASAAVAELAAALTAQPPGPPTRSTRSRARYSSYSAAAGQKVERIAAPARRSRAAVWVALGGGAAVVLAVVVWVAWREPRERSAPASQLRVAIVARNAGAASDAWLAPIVERRTRRALRDAEGRRFWLAPLDDPGDASTIELHYRRDGAAFRVEARAAGVASPLATAAAPAVVDAIAQLAPPLAQAMGRDRPAAGPDPAEAAEMARLDARSFTTYQEYRAILDAYSLSIFVDSHGVAARLERLIARDPAWAHPYALLAAMQGGTTPEAAATIERARRSIDRERDPIGARLLEGIEKTARGDTEGAAALFAAAYSEAPDDIVAAMEVSMAYEWRQRTEERIAVLRRLHETHPDLQFGANAAQALRRAGRGPDATRLVREWIELAPESEQARVELIKIEAEAGNDDLARREAERLIAIHGESASRLAVIYDAMVISNDLAEAHRLAERLLLGNPLARARGRYRLATLAVLQGRFAAAHEGLRAAVGEMRPHGLESELTQTLELARVVAPLVGDRAAALRYTTELAEVLARFFGHVAPVAAYRYEIALARRRGGRGGCPDPAPFLAALADHSERDAARRWIVRLAAAAGCARCEEAVTLGLSATEVSPVSLIALGRCAHERGELGLARQAFEQATHLWATTESPLASPYHAVLARFHLAEVLAAQGDRAGARAQYEKFITHWGKADRPIREVTRAREALATVKAP